jgi:hypothetical protein
MILSAHSERHIADTVCYRSAESEEGRANARLIAAAPELLKALEEVLEVLMYIEPNAVHKAQAAIKKAKGESDRVR